MNLDTTFMITASVVIYTEDIYGRTQTMRQVPTFYVAAVSEANARAIARDIIEAADTGDLRSIYCTAQCMADITIS